MNPRELPAALAAHVAAEAYRLDRRRLERDRKHGAFPNAYWGEGCWMIPRADLEASGHMLDPRWAKRHTGFLRSFSGARGA